MTGQIEMTKDKIHKMIELWPTTTKAELAQKLCISVGSLIRWGQKVRKISCNDSLCRTHSEYSTSDAIIREVLKERELGSKNPNGLFRRRKNKP